MTECVEYAELHSHSAFSFLDGASQPEEMAAEGGVPVIARMNNVKFRRMVRPGDTLDIHVELTKRARRLLHMQGTLKVGGKISCQLEFVATEASSGAAD